MELSLDSAKVWSTARVNLSLVTSHPSTSFFAQEFFSQCELSGVFFQWKPDLSTVKTSWKGGCQACRVLGALGKTPNTACQSTAPSLPLLHCIGCCSVWICQTDQIWLHILLFMVLFIVVVLGSGWKDFLIYPEWRAAYRIWCLELSQWLTSLGLEKNVGCFLRFNLIVGLCFSETGAGP